MKVKDSNSKLESIIRKLSSSSNTTSISKSDVSYLCKLSANIFLQESSLLTLDPPIYICGDIHGQLNDLIEIFRLTQPFPTSKILFLGDYVDRGPCGVEVFSLLLAYKIIYPNHIFLIRGNHEDRKLTFEFGFYKECVKKLSSLIYEQFNQVFDTLPIAAVIGSQLFCVHGGIGPELENLQQIRDLHRPLQIPESGFLADMLWSDPDPVVPNWCLSDRGEFHDYGRLQARLFLFKNYLSTLIRAHEYVPNGLEYPFLPDKSVLTVFFCFELSWKTKFRSLYIC